MSRLESILNVTEAVKTTLCNEGLHSEAEKLDQVDQQAEQLQSDLEYYQEKDRERNKYQIENLESDLYDELKDRFDEIIESTYPDDLLHVIADSYIPIYNWDLCQYLANDFSLASVDEEVLIEGVTDIFKIIQVSMYERLSSHVHECFRELAEERQEFIDHMVDRYSSYLNLLEDKIEELNDQLLDLDDSDSEEYSEIEDKIEELEERQENAQEKLDHFEEIQDNINGYL